MDAGELGVNPGSGFTNNGLYEFTSDADVVVTTSPSVGTMSFVNNGVVRKSGGVGTSEFVLEATSFSQDLRFSNTGTVEVETGTLLVDRPIVQTTGTTLTGGTWIVRDFATLAFHNSLDAANPNLPTPNYTTNLGNVTLDGSQSSFPNIDTLTKNHGGFAIVNGRDVSVAGDFFNTGTIQAGAGSTLSIGGNYTSSNLVGWWRGEGNAADSAGGLNGTIAGNVAFAPGQFGQTFRFPDTTGTIDLANPAALQIQDFTISAWVKPAVDADGPGAFLGRTVIGN